MQKCSWWVLVVVVLALLATVRCEEEAEEKEESDEEKYFEPKKRSEKVKELGDGNFDKEISQGTWFVHFYAGFCGKPCEEIEPMWAKLADKFEGKLNLGRVRHNTEVTRRMDVKEFPTALLIKDGQYYVYDLERDYGQLETFALKGYTYNIKKPVPAPLKTNSWVVDLNGENFDDKVFSKRGAYWVVLFFRGDDYNHESATLKAHYEGLALQELGKLNVGKIHGSETAVFKRMGITHTPTIAVIRGGELFDFEKAGLDKNNQNFVAFAEGGFEKVKGRKVAPAKAISADDEEGSQVVTLTDENFDKETGVMAGTNGTWFIEFYAPWCGHCKAIKPDWEKTAVKLRQQMRVGKVDCVANKNTSERFRVPGFPTLFLFKGGKFWKYDGEKRTAESFISWAREDRDEEKGMLVPLPEGEEPEPPTLAEHLQSLPGAMKDVITELPRSSAFLFVCMFSTGGILSFYVFLFRLAVKATKKEK